MKKKLLVFAAGALASTLVEKVVKTELAHKAAVNTVASGIQFGDKVKTGYEKIKEEATDLAYEAKLKAEAERAESFKVVHAYHFADRHSGRLWCQLAHVPFGSLPYRTNQSDQRPGQGHGGQQSFTALSQPGRTIHQSHRNPQAP